MTTLNNDSLYPVTGLTSFVENNTKQIKNRLQRPWQGGSKHFDDIWKSVPFSIQDAFRRTGRI